ncbi:Pimeloyl-ACP methyl ester carboxylesterase [Pustulibacterium marinum]|uniref:Pimeloyl-ACP methyl ester carboxylesterase n=1 Tax=Pustulibacterium marinum TaxID=1224947 RepID=A0A1I7I5M5_9FLAO|nr:alpha/beta fold hydrolase [Pustulibacterium marinum]SFU68227.1 Pimeloyl-ACP methyl ester carboxylesterase [Pustulibacterium marinum]
MPQLIYQNKNVHYQTSGSGKVVVLLHGFLESLKIWNSFSAELSKDYQVIAIDLPGHGTTDVFAEVHTMEFMAAVVHEVLVAENILKAAFIGHSMGGYVALAFLKNYPDLVSHLMLFNSSASEDSEEKKQNRDRGIKVVQQMPENFISMGVMNLFSEDHKKTFAPEIATLKEQALQTPVAGVIAALAGMKLRKASVQTLKEASIVKHYIIGNQDPTIQVAEILDQADEVEADTTVVAGGHMSYIENKDEALQAILSFLAK